DKLGRELLGRLGKDMNAQVVLDQDIQLPRLLIEEGFKCQRRINNELARLPFDLSERHRGQVNHRVPGYARLAAVRHDRILTVSSRAASPGIILSLFPVSAIPGLHARALRTALWPSGAAESNLLHGSETYPGNIPPEPLMSGRPIERVQDLKDL